MKLTNNFFLSFITHTTLDHNLLFSDKNIVQVLFKSLSLDLKRTILSLYNTRVYVDKLTNGVNELVKAKIINVTVETNFMLLELNSHFERNLFDLNYVVNQHLKPILYNENYMKLLKKIIMNEGYVPNTKDSSILNTVLWNSKLIDNNHEITTKGLEFLLMNKNEQIWYLIVEDIRLSSHLHKKLYSYAQVLNGHKIIDKKILNFLVEINVIDNIVDQNLYKYILYKNNTEIQKFIYLETNFKLYSYTNNLCDRAILDLFSNIVFEVPGMIKSILDEKKIMNTLDRGIKIQQIVEYIRRHTINNCDQILHMIEIWDKQRNRINKQIGYLYSDFTNYNEYRSVLEQIKTDTDLLYKNEEERILFVKNKLHI